MRFDDDEVQISKAQVDELLRSAQADADNLQLLDDDTNSSKDYLSKAVKSRNSEAGELGGSGFAGSSMMEEELWNESEMMNTF